MNKNLIVFALSTMAVIVLFFNILPFEKKSKVKVKCYFMAYACGDCYPKYKIKQVLSSENIPDSLLLERELKIEYLSSKIEQQIDTLTSKCAICYDFFIEGSLYYQHRKEYSILQVDKCVAQLRDSTCCE